ncbi:hypothetical protein TCAL_16776 [Tigriopus californicus]|uniref:Exonuclease domain-containing protein n=1 Tax=Tigriopus californicus TaxID=6832 RepID=A0A553PTZ7_TIGCA|nr:hypothetical protein TCAL_16776 [Tigriopus californicus]
MDSFTFNLFANEFQPQGSTTKSTLSSFNVLAPEFQPQRKTKNAPTLSMAIPSHKFNLLANKFYPETNDNGVMFDWSETQMNLQNRYLSLIKNSFVDDNEMFPNGYTYGEEEAMPVAEIGSTSFTPKLIPELYHKVPIVFGKFGMDSFDFGEHNPTSFCGLQGCLPNAYCNAMIQALYYQAGLHQVVLGHCCDMDTCLQSNEIGLCSHCGHFQPTNLSHSVQSLPESLTVYTGCNESVASVFWEQQSVHVANEATLTANVHGSKVDQGEDLWDQMRELDVSWIPESFKLRRLANGTLKGGATSEKSNVVEEQVEYELQSVCFTIVDPQTGKATNVVAAIKVGTYNSARFVLPESQWYLFNDFSINPIDSSEATWIDLNLKVPSILVYRRAGDLVALDAEFVTLTPEEKSSGRNGRLITVKAAVRLVGRVTCVRGWGPRRGVPFIDDHISCEEEISDYVSKYSGIFPGDLDPTQSSHHVFEEDLQEVLKNDFDMLGIVVPSDQVVDTVHLFHLPHWRLLSLKFLAWYFLDKHIQKECHNSNEDAGAALELYRSIWIWRPKER